MSEGGIASKKLSKVKGRKAKMKLADMPPFLARSLRLLDPTEVNEPTNRQQRRAKAKKGKG